MACAIPDSCFDVPIDNVKFIKRSLFVNAGNDNVYVACFCKDANGRQLPAIKKTKIFFACHHSGVGNKTPACGFKVSVYACKFIKEGDLLQDPFGQLTVPVCGSCASSVLQVVYSSPIKDFIGLGGYTCVCASYKERLDIPLEDKSISESWSIQNYFDHRQKIFGEINPKLKVLAAQVKIDEPSKSKKVYIPLD
jgi:hypothetical protein